MVENNKLQDDVFSLQKQRQEMQTEIGELQILVEDLKVRLSQTEAEHKQLQEEEQELLAKMNVCFCFVICRKLYRCVQTIRTSGGTKGEVQSDASI